MTDFNLYFGSLAVVAASAVYFLKPSKPAENNALEARFRAMQQQKKNSLTNAALGLDATKPGGRVLVLFGSQSGTAENFARVLADSGNEQGFFQVEARDLHEFDPSTLQDQPYVIFVMATFGEGDPTDNAVKFMNFLKSQTLETSTMTKVKYTVFGLGNKQYEHYNVVGRSVNDLMEKQGAQRVYPHGEGNAGGSIEEDFEAWRKDLWKTLRRSHDAFSGDDDVEVEEETSKPKAPTILFRCKPVSNDNPAKVFKDEDSHCGGTT